MRPGITTVLEKNSPPMWFYAGDRFHYEKLPEGTRVIYPAGTFGTSRRARRRHRTRITRADGHGAAARALDAWMKLTIAFDDLSIPLPPMRKPTFVSRSSRRYWRRPPPEVSRTSTSSRLSVSTAG